MFSSRHHSKVLAFLLFCLTVTAAQAVDVWGRSVPPQAAAVDAGTVTAGSKRQIVLTGTDDVTPEANLFYVIQNTPAHGTLSYTGNRIVYYTSDPNYSGPDSFTYTVFDGWLHSAPATVSLVVAARGPNHPPVISPGSQTVSNAGWMRIYASYWDPDGDPLTFTWTQPAHGTVKAGEPGQGYLCLYRATAGYTGPDTFTITANDGQVSSAPATFTITVVSTGGGAAPVAQAQTVTVFPVTGGFPILLKATDAENQAIGYTYSQPAHGTLSDGDAPYKVLYTPTAGYVGSDSFTFRATDGVGVSAPATVTLVVQANTPPMAYDVVLDVIPDQPITFELGGFDPEYQYAVGNPNAPSQSQNYQVVAGPVQGVLRSNPGRWNGQDTASTKGQTGRFWTYTPKAGFLGDDHLTWKVSDGFAISRTATLTLRVRPFGPIEHGQARVVAVVDATLSDSIQAEIDTWIQDLTAEGYRPFVKTWPRGGADNVAAKALWEWLRNEYFTNGLQGAVLFGQLPAPRQSDGVMDNALGILADWKNEGLNRQHQELVQRNYCELGNPIIWTSRLLTSSAAEMRWYLRANHEERTGRCRLPRIGYSLTGNRTPFMARGDAFRASQAGLRSGTADTLFPVKYCDLSGDFPDTPSTCSRSVPWDQGGVYSYEHSHGNGGGNGFWLYSEFKDKPFQSRIVTNASCGPIFSNQTPLVFGRHGKLTNVEDLSRGYLCAALYRQVSPLDRGGSLGEERLWFLYSSNQTPWYVGDGSLGLATRFPENRTPVIVSAECVSGAIVAGRSSTWRLRVTDPDAPSGNNPFVPWQFKSEWYLNGGWNVDLNPTLTSDTTQTAAWTFDAATKVWTNQSTLTFTQAQTRVIRTLVLDEWQALAWKDQTIAVAPDPTQPLRINCGSNQSWKVNNKINPPADYTDGQGHIWFHCQTFMTGGWGWTCGNSGYVFTGSPIAGTDLDPLFQSGLTVLDPVKPLSYRIPLSNGRYTVNLGFAALTETAAGQAVMDVAIEGQVVLDDLDVFAAAGAAKTALWRTFTAQVNDGELTIVFTRLAVSTKDPAICAIEILPLQIPPTCAITAPTDGATFTAPANITITADAADSDGTIAKVEFYNGTTKLGEDTTSPYSYAWNNVALGTYSLTVKATDNEGAVTTSAVVAITVQAAQDRTIIIDLLPGLIWDALEPADATVLPPSGGRQTIRVRSQQSTLLVPVVGNDN